MKPHQQRVADEKSELDLKISKLDEFIQRNPSFLSIDAEEQARLKRQYSVMAEYSSILGERIAAFN